MLFRFFPCSSRTNRGERNKTRTHSARKGFFKSKNKFQYLGLWQHYTRKIHASYKLTKAFLALIQIYVCFKPYFGGTIVIL